jgi:hypothetical protein
MSSPFSLGFKNSEELSPPCIINAFREVMVFDHGVNLQVLNNNGVMGFSVLFGYLEMKVTSLPLNLQMGLGRIACSLAPSSAALLASAKSTLLVSEGSLTLAIRAWVLDRVPFGVSQEDFQPNIKADVRMGAFRMCVLCLGLCFTHDEGIPVPISTMNEVNRLGLAFKRAMQLDLEEMTKLLGHNEVFLVLMHIAVFPLLSELDRMPTVRLLETWEANRRSLWY